MVLLSLGKITQKNLCPSLYINSANRLNAASLFLLVKQEKVAQALNIFGFKINHTKFKFIP